MSEHLSPVSEAVVRTSLRTWLGAVTDLARAVKVAEPLEVLLGRVAENACTLIGFDFGAVMLSDPSGERLLVQGSHGLSEAYVGRLNTDVALRLDTPDPGVDAPAARAVREGITVTADDIAGLPDFDRLRWLAEQEGYRALLAAPLLSGGAPIGVLVAYSARARAFAPSEIELAELLAEHAAVAVETARLRENEQQAIAELTLANEALRAHQDVVDRAGEQHRRLMELALDDVGLPRLVSWLASTLQASVTVEGMDGTVLARAPGAGYVAPPRHESPRHRSGPWSTRERYELVELRPWPADGSTAAAWETPIVLAGEVAGRLWLSGSWSDPAPVDRRTVERFALVVAFELLKQRHGVEVEARVSQDVLTDLLRAVGTEVPRALVERAAALGSDLTTPHTIVVLDVDVAEPEHGDDLRPRVARLAAAQMAGRCERGGRILVGLHDGVLVLLLPADRNGTEQVRRVVRRLEHATRPHSISAVIGGTGTSPAQHSTACRTARTALELVQRSGGGRVLDLGDLGVHALLLEAGVAPSLVAFARRLLDPLEQHDARHGAELVATLRTWLDENCSTTATARALVVHRNTVAHRLRRIEDLLGRPLRSPSVLLQLQLAAVIRDVEDTGRP